MEMTTSNIIQIMVYLVTFGILIGTLKTQNSALKEQYISLKEQLSMQISSLEKKVEKHNGVIERTYICEESLKSAHHRLDELREEVNNVRKIS